MHTKKRATKEQADLVQFELNALPPMTEQQKKELAVITTMPDSEIDYSDAPHRPDAVWIRVSDAAAQNKKQISLRVDADVLEFFKNTGKRYQSRMNAVLRSYVEAAKHTTPA